MFWQTSLTLITINTNLFCAQIGQNQQGCWMFVYWSDGDDNLSGNTWRSDCERCHKLSRKINVLIVYYQAEGFVQDSQLVRGIKFIGTTHTTSKLSDTET